MKMKRKDGGVDEVSDEFSDFSLSSPARKIRRLDHHVLPPIMEDDDLQSHPQPYYYNYCHNPQDLTAGAASGGGGGSSSVVIEELPSDFDSDVLLQHVPSPNPVHTFSDKNPDQERAIVLFKPVSMPPHCSPSSFSHVSVDPHVLSGIKNNRFPWSSIHGNNGQMQEDKNNEECLAVVPWVPSSLVSAPVASPEFVEADEMDVDFQDNNRDTATAMEQQVATATTTVNVAPSSPGTFPPWQQHCMIPPQIPPICSTPIRWSQ